MHFLVGHRFLRRHLNPSLWVQLKQLQHNKARVLLLPEVPEDTAENNAFIRQIEERSLPDFSAWPFRDAVSGTAKIGLEYEGWLLDHFEHMAESAQEATSSFSSLMDPLELRSVPVDIAWYTLSQHYAVQYAGKTNAKNHINGLGKMAQRLLVNRFASPEYHKALKDLLASKKVGDGWQKRLVEHDLTEAHLNGLDLKPHKARELAQIREHIAMKKTDYLQHVANSSTRLNARTVDDFADLPNAPEHILRFLSGRPEGPLSFPFDIAYTPEKFALYLQYCKRRMLRLTFWHMVNSRAAFSEDTSLYNNSSVVEAMRLCREREAKWLGYKNYAESQLSLCMANSADEVKEFLTKFGEKASDKLDAVYEDMCAIAEAEGENVSKEPPDAWDLSYYARKVAEEKFKLNQHAFAEYFPYPQTMKNIFNHVEKLFGIEFKNVSETVPRWHQTVETYEIRNRDNGALIAHLYIDPYCRNQKALMPLTLPGRPRSETVGTTPIAYLNLPLTQPTPEKPSLLYLDQLSSLCFQLGRALQFVLSTAPYSFMQGYNLVEFDCKHVCARVIELLLTGRASTLAAISNHYQSGKKLDLETAQSYVKGQVMIELPKIVREIVDSELDISLYSTRLFWRDIYRDLHAKYLPFKWQKNKGDEFICNFGGYVTENIASKYYSVLWSKKLASDIVEAFDETKGDEKSLTEVGKRFADVFLFNGGKYSHAEMFKQFRGRDPILEPMVKFYTSC